MVAVSLPNTHALFWRLAAIGGAAALLLSMAAPVSAHEREQENEYIVHKLVSDVPGRAAVTDPNLVNGWGITASEGPGPATLTIDGKKRRFYDYVARSIPNGPDDGTIAPWAVVASLPFAPEIVLPTIRAIDKMPGA